VEFRILGPLEVAHGGTVRALAAGGGELTVLALLVLNAGRIVAADALIDASWGERPPANPANALQIRVSKLRRALLAAGLPDNVLVTRRPGYVIEMDPDQVDAHRFVRLMTEARQAADRDPPAAGALYGRALGLWRGPALPEFATQAWAVPEVTPAHRAADGGRRGAGRVGTRRRPARGAGQ
jgi:DNA-binding SARP family transcriptional activator